MSELERLREEKYAAQDRLNEAVQRRFPQGTKVEIRWGDTPRLVEIVQHRRDRALVLGATGSPYWIDHFFLYRDEIS